MKGLVGYVMGIVGTAGCIEAAVIASHGTPDEMVGWPSVVIGVGGVILLAIERHFES